MRHGVWTLPRDAQGEMHDVRERLLGRNLRERRDPQAVDPGGTGVERHALHQVRKHIRKDGQPPIVRVALGVVNVAADDHLGVGRAIHPRIDRLQVSQDAGT